MTRRMQGIDPGVVQARERFHAVDGAAGAAVVAEVARSWERSRQLGLSMHSRALFDEVSRSRQREVEGRNRHLIEFAMPEMERLLTSLSRSDWVLACIDEQGAVVASLSAGQPDADLRCAFRTGVDLTEAAVGTTAPGCALTEQRPVAVIGDEHFLKDLGNFSCIAVPIFGPDGGVLGALDASCGRDGNPMMAMEPLFVTARAVENRILHAIPEAVRIGFHYRDDMLGSPMEGVMAWSRDGRLLGLNQVARRLLGVDGRGEGLGFESLFETGFGEVMDRLRRSGDTPWQVQNRDGLRLNLHCRDRRPQRPVAVTHSAPPDTGVQRDDAILKRAIGLAHNAQAYDIPVLIAGETGTGKDLLARRIHDEGDRASAPFVAVNCSAIPAGLVESELFGYEDGAFSGARRGGAPGRFEQAQGGTLFLDEVGDMPLELQARLLRVLQDRCVMRVGGLRRIELDVRVVCATHRDLRAMVVDGTFREDLYYRINGLRITLPPLRERPDLPDLIRSHLDAVARDGRAAPAVSDAAMRLLQAYRWPGNVRQLGHVLRLAAMLAGPDGVIEPEHLHEDLTDALRDDPSLCGPVNGEGDHADGSLQRAERQAVEAALSNHGGNISAAARALGIGRETLYRKMRAHGISMARPQDTAD